MYEMHSIQFKYTCSACGFVCLSDRSIDRGLVLRSGWRTDGMLLLPLSFSPMTWWTSVTVLFCSSGLGNWRGRWDERIECDSPSPSSSAASCDHSRRSNSIQLNADDRGSLGGFRYVRSTYLVDAIASSPAAINDYQGSLSPLILLLWLNRVVSSSSLDRSSPYRSLWQLMYANTCQLLFPFYPWSKEWLLLLKWSDVTYGEEDHWSRSNWMFYVHILHSYRSPIDRSIVVLLLLPARFVSLFWWLRRHPRLFDAFYSLFSH